jgi:hypothetical protein
MNNYKYRYYYVLDIPMREYAYEYSVPFLPFLGRKEFVRNPYHNIYIRMRKDVHGGKLVVVSSEA